MRISSYIFSFVNLIIFVLSLFFKEYDLLVYASMIVSIFMVLDKLGKGIVLREIIALYNSLIYLFMPLMGYLFYTRSNPIAASFVRFMPVTKSTYFDLALPAVTGFILLLCWPIRSSYGDEGDALRKIIDNGKKRIAGNQRIGIGLLIVGVVISFLIQYLPVSLQYVFTLFYFSSFAGLLYIYFAAEFPFKKTVMMLFVLFILSGSIRNGMFTILAYMGMTVFSFIFLNKKVALWKKFIVFSLAVFVLIIIQTVKSEYRRNVLRTDKENKTSEFFNLVMKRIDNIENFVTPNYMWPIYYRTNQGFYVGLVQRYIPRVRPYDEGANLLVIVASAFVPRFLWPDKPMAGGAANMKYYAGYTIKGYTVNVGPLGEAYGSFGVTGGIIYMMFLGAFIRFAYRSVFKIGSRIPLLIFWLPVLFYQISYSGENDTLQIMNSLMKSAFFIWFLYKAFPKLLNPPIKIAPAN